MLLPAGLGGNYIYLGFLINPKIKYNLACLLFVMALELTGPQRKDFYGLDLKHPKWRI